MTKTVYVIAYLAGIVWLAGWELSAFFVNTRYTLSDLTWAWEGAGWTAARYLVLASLTWLTLHLAFRWLR